MKTVHRKQNENLKTFADLEVGDSFILATSDGNPVADSAVRLKISDDSTNNVLSFRGGVPRIVTWDAEKKVYLVAIDEVRISYS